MTIQDQIRGIRELVVRGIDEKKRVVKFVGVTETVASDGGILRISGANWERMDANPVVKWNHGDEVIGKIIKREVDKKAKEVIFHVEFAGPEVSEFADSRYRLVKADFVRASSIGFQVDAFAELTDKQRDQEGLGQYGWVASAWTGHELSVVPVGADPKALKRAIDAGAIRQEDIDMEPPQYFADKDGRAPKDMPNDSTQGFFIDDEVSESFYDNFKPNKSNPPMTFTELRAVDQIEDALNANTKEQQRTQVLLHSLTNEISGLTEFLARGDKGAEIVEGVEPDSTDADADERAEVAKAITELSERVANLGDRNDRQDSGSD